MGPSTIATTPVLGDQPAAGKGAAAAQQQPPQPQQQAVLVDGWARLQSVLQRIDNMERLVVSPANAVHNYGYQHYPSGPQLVWPRHNGVSVPVRLEGGQRPDSLYLVKYSPDSVIDALLRHYELPHGNASGTLEERRRVLMRHIGVINGTSSF